MKHVRLDELADGIFSIVMTLLVFEIKVPALPGGTSNLELWMALKVLTPSILSYILSFFLLFTYWRAHHFFITIYAKNIDMKLTNINAVFFLLVALVPFTASLLSRFSHNQLAISIFGINIILTGMVLFWMRRYVLYSEEIQNPDISKREIHGSTVRTLVPVVSALIAIPLSFANTQLALVVLTLAILFNLSSSSTKLFEKIYSPK
jgi:uncharacterized membrane protein